jgi:hypothetical protein
VFQYKTLLAFSGIINAKKGLRRIGTIPHHCGYQPPGYFSPVSPVFLVAPVSPVAVAVDAANPESLPGLLESWVSLAALALAAALRLAWLQPGTPTTNPFSIISPIASIRLRYIEIDFECGNGHVAGGILMPLE